MNSSFPDDWATTAPAEAARSLQGAQAPSPWFRRLLAFAGPGYLIAVGYIDPGNWATSLAAGSGYGYALLSIVLLSSLMAMLLQSAAVRLGVASGLDLAQACRQHFGARTRLGLWLACEIAIVACNLAEVLGMACGLNLLFHIPLTAGVYITLLDVTLVLALQHRGMCNLEAFIVAMVALISGCLALQLWWLHPSAVVLLSGLIPPADVFTHPDMLYVAIGIVGATVMPHNLYLHSAIVQRRVIERSDQGLREAIRYATHDSNIALALALLANMAILVLAAGALHRSGQAPVTGLDDAYHLLSPLLGVGAASAVFGIGLVASGLSSSITGTLAGQIVMEGFLQLRMSRFRRSVLTRALAIVPAAIVVSWFGSAGIGKLLILSQVILGLQLPFAVIPLLWFTTRRKWLGPYAFGKGTATVLWLIAASVIAGNLWLLCTLTTV